MLCVEALYLIPLMSAWHAWDGLTVLAPVIAKWKVVWLFARFCLEEYLTVHWCEILDEAVMSSPKYHKYLMQWLSDQTGEVSLTFAPLILQNELMRLPYDRTFFHLAIGRWILCCTVAQRFATRIRHLALLILCWDIMEFMWNLDLSCIFIQSGPLGVGRTGARLHTEAEGELTPSHSQ